MTARQRAVRAALREVSQYVDSDPTLLTGASGPDLGVIFRGERERKLAEETVVAC